MEYNYEVIRSVRKTVSVSVSPENKITVRAPRGLSDKRIKEFLDGKKSWLEKAVSANARKLNANRDILNYESVYVCGKKLPLVISVKNEITYGCVFVKSINKIKDLYIKSFSADFLKLAQKLSAQTRLPAASFSIKAYKSKWGCCDSEKNIAFNYLLFMLPYEIQEYVIVHELTHTVCFNHSPAFWRLVGEYVPDYKKIRKALKSYDFLMGLYCYGTKMAHNR